MPDRSPRRDATIVWIGQAVSDTGTAFTIVALPLVAVLLLHATPVEMALLVTAESSPILLSLLLTRLVSGVSLRTVMVVADLLRAVALSTVPLALVMDALTIPHLFAVALVMGCCGAVHVIASQALLPLLVDGHDLLRVNAKLEASSWLTYIAAPPTAGFVVRAAGPAVAFLVDAVSYLSAGLALLFVRPPRNATVSGTGDAADARQHAVRDGIAFLRRHRALRRLTLSNALANLALFWCMPLQALFLLRTLHASPIEYGLLVGLPCIGGLAGSAIVTWLGTRVPTPVLLLRLSILRGLGQALIVFAQPGFGGLAYFCGAATVATTAAGGFNALQVTYRQQLTPAPLRASVHAASRTLLGAGQILGPVLGALLVGVVGLRGSLMAGAGLLLAATVLLVRTEEPPSTAPRDAVSVPAPSTPTGT